MMHNAPLGTFFCHLFLCTFHFWLRVSLLCPSFGLDRSILPSSLVIFTMEENYFSSGVISHYFLVLGEVFWFSTDRMFSHPYPGCLCTRPVVFACHSWFTQLFTPWWFFFIRLTCRYLGLWSSRSWLLLLGFFLFRPTWHVAAFIVGNDAPPSRLGLCC